MPRTCRVLTGGDRGSTWRAQTRTGSLYQPVISALSGCPPPRVVRSHEAEVSPHVLESPLVPDDSTPGTQALSRPERPLTRRELREREAAETAAAQHAAAIGQHQMAAERLAQAAPVGGRRMPRGRPVRPRRLRLRPTPRSAAPAHARGPGASGAAPAPAARRGSGVSPRPRAAPAARHRRSRRGCVGSPTLPASRPSSDPFARSA